MSPMYMILKNKKCLPATQPEWVAFMESGDKILSQENIGPYFVSTVFISVPFPLPLEDPYIFETLVRQGEEVVETYRYTNYDEAMAGHQEAVKMAESGNFENEQEQEQ